jgi:hypothetical protein
MDNIGSSLFASELDLQNSTVRDGSYAVISAPFGILLNVEL